jgi:hypothetical protein
MTKIFTAPLKISLASLLLAAALGGCATQATGQKQAGLPGTYVGMLPCADCEGIETTLTLSKDGRFTLDQRYQKAGALLVPPDHGRWQDEGRYLELFAEPAAADGSRQCFGVLDADTLVAYDMACLPIEDAAGGVLKRQR